MKYYILVAVVLFCQQSMGQLANPQSAFDSNYDPLGLGQGQPPAQLPMVAPAPNVPAPPPSFSSLSAYPKAPQLNNNITAPGANQVQVGQCQQAMQKAVTECSSNMGIGSAAASMMQQQANQYIQQQQMNQAMAGAQGGGVTVVNISNQGQQNPGVNSACNATKYLGAVNMGAGMLQGTFCYQAVQACHDNCYYSESTDVLAIQQQTAYQKQCDTALQHFQMAIIPQAATAMLTSLAGAKCNAATAITTDASNPPPLLDPPAPPNVNEPTNQGMQPFAAGTAAPPGFAPEGGTGGGGALGTSGYPGGAGGDNKGQGKDSATIADHSLGVNGSGGGGGWPTGGGGGGNNGKGAAPFDLSSLLPGHDKYQSRMPAGMNEITGANDLTNFQKVTRAMNKKRPVLKAGDGA